MSKIVNILFSDGDFSYLLCEGNEPTLIPNTDYEIIGHHPFAISYCRNDKWLFGSAAIEYSRDNYGSTVFSIYDLLDAHKKIELNGEIFDPLIILVKLFERINITAKNYLGQEVRYTITLPNDWNLFQKQFIQKAAHTASIYLERIFKYTDCIAINYLYSNPEIDDKRILSVYLDVNSIHIGIYDIGNETIYTLSTTSSKRFNNKLLVDKLILYCLSEYKSRGYQSYNIDFTYLKLRCESALREVFAGQDVSIFVTDQTDNQKSIYVELNAQKVFEILKPQFDDLFHDIIETAEIVGCSLDRTEIVLIDTGSRSNTYLSYALKSIFACPIVYLNNYVREGGTIYGGVLEGSVTDVLLIESFANDIGVLLKDGIKCKLIEKHTTIPTKRTETFRIRPSKNQIEIPVYSGNNFIGGQVTHLNTKEENEKYDVHITIDIDTNSKITLETKIMGTETKENKIVLPLENFSMQDSIHVTSELEILE